jgi:hypothetical protein
MPDYLAIIGPLFGMLWDYFEYWAIFGIIWSIGPEP